MATTSSALAGTWPRHAAGRPRPRWPAGERLLSAVGLLNAFVWGAQKPILPGAADVAGPPVTPAASDARRRAEIARMTGPVLVGAHPAPTPPIDKRSAVAHYRALAEQVARERRCIAVLDAGGAARDA